jgi:hypothetical protein
MQVALFEQYLKVAKKKRDEDWNKSLKGLFDKKKSHREADPEALKTVRSGSSKGSAMKVIQ